MEHIRTEKIVRFEKAPWIFVIFGFVLAFVGLCGVIIQAVFHDYFSEDTLLIVCSFLILGGFFCSIIIGGLLLVISKIINGIKKSKRGISECVEPKEISRLFKISYFLRNIGIVLFICSLIILAFSRNPIALFLLSLLCFISGICLELIDKYFVRFKKTTIGFRG